MAPTAFVRRPQRWIRALSDASREGRVVTAAPNFAYEWAAQRGNLPERGGHRPGQRRGDHRLGAGEHGGDRRIQ